jgi:hypothetical protein
MNGNTNDAAQGQARKGGRKDFGPNVGAKNVERAGKESSRHEETEQNGRPDPEHIGEDQQRGVETESKSEPELMTGYRQHPHGALFPPVPEQELRAWASDIREHGQRHDIVRHPDGSILDGWNNLRACLMAGVEPRITGWGGKPGEELAFVISQNVLRRHLNESQRAMIANKLAALPSGQRQGGKFAGVLTQAQAAEMLHVSERSVRTARKVDVEAPTNLTRLVYAGRLSLNAVECLVPHLSPEDKQRIEGMSDDDTTVEVERLNNKRPARIKRTMERAADSQANEACAAATPPAIETSAITADNNDDDNRGIGAIGAEAVSRALNRAEIQADTPERQAFVGAIARLLVSDAGWACGLMPFVEQEARRNAE